MTDIKSTFSYQFESAKTTEQKANELFAATAWFAKLKTHIAKTAKGEKTVFKITRRQEGPAFGWFEMNPIAVRMMLVIAICLTKGGSNTVCILEVENESGGFTELTKDNAMEGAKEYAEKWKMAHPGKPADITQRGIGNIAWNWWTQQDPTFHKDVLATNPYIKEIMTKMDITDESPETYTKFSKFISTYSIEPGLTKGQREKAYQTLKGWKTKNTNLKDFLLGQIVKDIICDMRDDSFATAKTKMPENADLATLVNARLSFQLGYNLIQSNRFTSFSTPFVLVRGDLLSAVSQAEEELKTGHRYMSKASSLNGFVKQKGVILATRNFKAGDVRAVLADEGVTSVDTLLHQLNLLHGKQEGKGKSIEKIKSFVEPS